MIQTRVSKTHPTHLLLATLIAGPLDARLPLLLVAMLASDVVVICGLGTVADCDRAPLPLGWAATIAVAIGRGVGKDLAPDRDRAGGR